MNLHKLFEDKNIVSKDICVAVVIKKDDKFLMGLREYQKSQPIWTFPGGRCDEGETIKETILREVEEEIGINDLKITRFLGQKKGVAKEDEVYFFEGQTNQEPQLMEPEKFLEWRWISLDDLPDNLIDNTDMEFIK